MYSLFFVCLRLQTLKIVNYCCVLCNFLACPRFPWVPVASVSFLCIVCNYVIVYVVLRSARPSPLYVLILRQLCNPCVFTLTMYVPYVLFVPNKPFVR